MKYSLKKYEKLSLEKEFKYVFQNGKKIFSPYLRLYFAVNNLNYSRLGISIKKKFGNAVERNKAKRHIREIFRLNKNLKQNVDLIVIIENKFKTLNFEARKNTFLSLLKKINLI